MDIPQFIRDNTDDGRDIVTFLIEAMSGGIDGCKLGHRLTAARLLVIYGHDDAPGFIADNATPRMETRDKQWLTIDPALARLIRIKTDDGRDICRFLIDVMQGRVENINPGHRVSAARDLLSRAFGKSPGRPLPRTQRSTEGPRSTTTTVIPAIPTIIPSEAGTQRARDGEVLTPDSSPLTPRNDAPTTGTPTAVLDKPEQQPEPDANRGIDIENDVDYWLAVYDSDLYEFMNECEDPDFDPYLAAIDEEYFKSFTGCKDPECMVHGEPPEIDFDPNDYRY